MALSTSPDVNEITTIVGTINDDLAEQIAATGASVFIKRLSAKARYCSAAPENMPVHQRPGRHLTGYDLFPSHKKRP